jgi:hypothetical protein
VHVKEKAQKSKAKALAKRDEQEKKERARIAIVRVQESIGLPLLSPLIDQGVSFFMMNYAVGLDQPTIQSNAYNRHLSTFGFHPLIATSMTALGLAGISNICLDAKFKREAMLWYSKALQMTNAALASPTEVTSDNTLFATLLLSTFEATTNESTLSGWSSHVSGTEALLRMRGKKQFNTRAGRRMFKQAIGLVTMNCMGMGKAVPDYVHAMNKELEKHEDLDHPGTKYYYLHLDVVNFRASVSQSKIKDLSAIIDRALELDKAAKHIFDDTGPEWEFQVVDTDAGTPGVFGTSYHIYPHLASAQVWNWVRYNRIYIQDIVRNCLIAGFGTIPPAFTGTRYVQLLQESQEILYQMQYDILASIPQHLHDTPKNFKQYMPDSASSKSSSLDDSLRVMELSSSPAPGSSKFFWSNFQDEDNRLANMNLGVFEDKIPVVRIAGGYSSVWSLFIVGTTPISTPESQAYVIRSLERVSNEFGINQAKVLSDAVRLKAHLDATGRTEFKIVPDYLPALGAHFEY